MTDVELLHEWEEAHREYLQATYRWLQMYVLYDVEVDGYEAFVRFAYEHSDPWTVSPGMPRLPPPMSPQRLRELPPWKSEWRVLKPAAQSDTAAPTSLGG